MLRRLLAGAAATRSPAAVLRRMFHVDGGGCRGYGEAESVAYRISMLRPPSAVPRWKLTRNSCSLIGRLAAPVMPHHDSCDEYPKAYTFLSVTPPSSAPSSSSSSWFTVTLHLEGELANVSLKHLKHNDLVYVSGVLSSYHKVNSSGERYIIYKLKWKKENKYIDRLRLWQVFFANPSEWWDNRESKPYVKCPDFKHKDNNEKIWLHPDDPPWVRKQLELHDLEK